MIALLGNMPAFRELSLECEVDAGDEFVQFVCQHLARLEVLALRINRKGPCPTLALFELLHPQVRIAIRPHQNCWPPQKTWARIWSAQSYRRDIFARGKTVEKERGGGRTSDAQAQRCVHIISRELLKHSKGVKCSPLFPSPSNKITCHRPRYTTGVERFDTSPRIGDDEGGQ